MIPSRRCARLSPQPILTPSGALPLAAPLRQALVATLGYNNVEARLLAPVGFSFDVAAEGDCAVTLMPDVGVDFAGEVVLEAQFIADGELLRREHRVFLGFSEERTDFFIEDIDWVAGLFDGEPFAPLDDADRRRLAERLRLHAVAGDRFDCAFGRKYRRRKRAVSDI